MVIERSLFTTKIRKAGIGAKSSSRYDHITAKHEVRVELSRQEGWFSNGYIGKPEIIMNVESQSADVSDLDKVVTGPTWGFGPNFNSTRGVSPAGVTLIIERDSGRFLENE